MANFLKNIFKFSQEEVKNPTKESFDNAQQFLSNLMVNGVGGWKNKFISDIYKERILYPHEEMDVAKKALNYNAYVSSSTRTRANFITGGTIKANSEDEATEKQVDKIIRNSNLYLLANNIGIDTAAFGNFYAEKIYDPDNNKFLFYEYIPFPERMYADLTEYGTVGGWLLEQPEQLLGSTYDTIRYYGDRRKTVKGQKIPKEKIFHLKLGRAEIPAYGRGLIAPVINDVEILLEIERAIAVIARYKAIPKKLIQLTRENDTGATKAANTYANLFSQLGDDENPIVPESMKVDDLSYAGKELNFEPIVNYLKKKITVAMAPSYIMHGEETNYAVSRDQKEAFILEIKAERESLKEQLKREIRFIAKNWGIFLKDFEISFGDFDLGQSEWTKQYAIDTYQAGLITLNEAREILSLPEDTELGDLYGPEISAQSGLFGLGNNGEKIESEIREANSKYQQDIAKKKLRND